MTMNNNNTLLIFGILFLVYCAGEVSAQPLRSLRPADLPEALVKDDNGPDNFGMVSTTNPLATAAGVEILRRGGSAADAMVAVQAVLGLVEPQSSGLGGGSFAVYYDAKSDTITTFDGREKAPSAATEDRFSIFNGSFFSAWQSGLSVGVPGTPRLLETIQAKYGKKNWKNLFDSAIELATDGFEITQRTSGLVSVLLGFGLFRDPTARAYFANPDGRTAKPPGTVLQNPEYAATLQAMIDGGADAFYNGPIAEAIASAVENDLSVGGDLTPEDLANYNVVERDPVCVLYKGINNICGMGAPSSGGIAVGQIMGILDKLSVAADSDPLDAENVHLFTQANRLAFADRNLYVADSDFVSVPTEGLLDADYLANRATLVKAMDTVAEAGSPDGASRFGPDARAKDTGTTHFSIVDKFGNALSMTSSIEAPFGNGVMTNGFLLNNELTDFSFASKDSDGQPIANRVQGNKRPRSSMSPTIVMDTRTGIPKILTGSPGGSRIIGYTAQSIWNILEFGLDAQETINVPHYQNRNDNTVLENPISGVTLDYDVSSLKDELNNSFGHSAEQNGGLTSGLSVIRILEDGNGAIYEGGADYRRDGSVA